MRLPPLPDDLKADFEGEERRPNRDNLRGLVRALRDQDGIIPFVGAGMSAPFGLPLWSRFLETEAKAARVTEIPVVGDAGGATLPLAEALSRGYFEAVATRLVQVRKRLYFNQRVIDRFGRHAEELEEFDWQGVGTDSLQPSLPPVFVLPLIARGPVLTTNFDPVLELVYETAKAPFRAEDVVYGPEAKQALPRMGKNVHFLLKLHGGTEPSRSRVLTSDEYDREYGEDPEKPDLTLPLPALLKMLAASRSFLFLGCSLLHDRTLTVLRTAAEEADLPLHFALMARPADAAEEDATLTRLFDHAIQPIFYDPSDRHARVGSLLRYLARCLAGENGSGGGGTTISAPTGPVTPVPPVAVSAPAGLDGTLVQQLVDALVSAFNAGSLARMVRFELGESLGALVGPGSLRDVAFALVEWAAANGKVKELFLGARRQNDGNPALKALEPILKARGIL